MIFFVYNNNNNEYEFPYMFHLFVTQDNLINKSTIIIFYYH